MRINLLVILFICLFYMGFSQNKHIINKESTSYTIAGDQDSITFLVIDNDITSKKPIFLWCQGSQPVPLYINFKKDGLWLIGGGISNFDYEEIKKHYHLVVISMPQTPLIVDESKISKSYFYIGDSPDNNTPSVAFQKEDYLENYRNRAIKVLQFLTKQKWVDNSTLIVVGHSQGSKVATEIAINYKYVSKLGLFSANPFGRIDQNIRKHRKDAENKTITWQQADKKIEQEYQFYKAVNDTEKVNANPSLIPWKSFSNPQLNDWLFFNKPIYMAYGTSDNASDLCDLVPLYFIRENKHNLTYKRYLNLEHNFFEVNEKQEVDHSKPHWKEVMNSFLKWTLQ